MTGVLRDFGLVAAFSAGLLLGCEDPAAAPAAPGDAAGGPSSEDPSVGFSVYPGDLLIVDADAAGGTGAGAPRGLLFLAPARGDGGYLPARAVVRDPRWAEPLDVLVRPDGSLVVLESKAPVGDGPGVGGLYRVKTETGSVELWWTDDRLRQPVGMALTEDGTLYVSDRAADPLGLGEDTGAVFVLDTNDGTPRVTSVIAGPELVTPAGLLAVSDGRVLLMDADANPEGHDGTPGVLFEIQDGELRPVVVPAETTSPVGLIERGPGELFLVDCNEGRDSGVYADGALFRIEDGVLVKIIDSYSVGRPRALHDPTLGDALPDGRLAVADISADPLGLGEDGSQGFMGSGPGAILALDPDAGTVETLLASELFVTPISVRRVRE